MEHKFVKKPGVLLVQRNQFLISNLSEKESVERLIANIVEAAESLD
jgi:hypothetical protein